MRLPVLALALALAQALACGPAAPGATAPASFAPATPRLERHARALLDRFDADRAHALVAFVDRFFRVRGNDGYQASLDRVRQELAARGLRQVRTLELGEIRPTWTPQRARLALLAQDGQPSELVRFDDESAPDRACLLVGSDAIAPITLEVVRAEAVRAGQTARGRLVLAEGAPRRVYREFAEHRGAIGILVRHLEPLHRAEEHPDAARFGYLPPHEGRVAIGFSLSDRAWRALRAATEGGRIAQVSVEIAVRTGASAATAVEARIEGSDPDAGAIVLVAHVDEPGANDNASGVVALLELAGALHGAIAERAVPSPRRTLVFVWGQEMEGSSVWLERASMPVAAGLVMDMVGADPAIVGAPLLLERMPDPGAVWLRDPDRPSGWGRSEIDASQLIGHFLNDYARAAIRAVRAARGGEPWRWRTHPFEGGSDHVSFLRRGIPAILAWHFPDDAYHTSRDRLERVSGAEMRRVAAAIGAAAIGMASGARADREEMLAAVRAAAIERMAWARDAALARIAAGHDRALERRVIDAWARWYDEAMASIERWDGDDPALTEALVAARAEIEVAHRHAAQALEVPGPAQRTP